MVTVPVRTRLAYGVLPHCAIAWTKGPVVKWQVFDILNLFIFWSNSSLYICSLSEIICYEGCPLVLGASINIELT